MVDKVVAYVDSLAPGHGVRSGDGMVLFGETLELGVQCFAREMAGKVLANRMGGRPAVDEFFHFVGETVVDPRHVGEAGIAAGRGQDLGQQERRERRAVAEGGIAVPG